MKQLLFIFISTTIFISGCDVQSACERYVDAYNDCYAAIGESQGLLEPSVVASYNYEPTWGLACNSAESTLGTVDAVNLWKEAYNCLANEYNSQMRDCKKGYYPVIDSECVSMTY